MYKIVGGLSTERIEYERPERPGEEPLGAFLMA
jgi:hypothetical protein